MAMASKVQCLLSMEPTCPSISVLHLLKETVEKSAKGRIASLAAESMVPGASTIHSAELL